MVAFQLVYKLHKPHSLSPSRPQNSTISMWIEPWVKLDSWEIRLFKCHDKWAEHHSLILFWTLRLWPAAAPWVNCEQIPSKVPRQQIAIWANKHYETIGIYMSTTSLLNVGQIASLHGHERAEKRPLHYDMSFSSNCFSWPSEGYF